MPTSTLEALPYRLLLQICQSLDYRTILRLSQVSKTLRRMTQEQDLDVLMFRNTPGTKIPEHTVNKKAFELHPLIKNISFTGGFKQEIQNLTVYATAKDTEESIKFLDCGAINEMAVWPPVTSLRVSMSRHKRVLSPTLKTIRRETGVRVVDVVKLMISAENALVTCFGPEFRGDHFFFEDLERISYQNGVLLLVAYWGS